MATRMKGKGLSLTIGGDEFNVDGISVVLDSEDADQEASTFEEYTESGGNTPQQWFFTLGFLQNLDADSFWRAMWDAHTAGVEIAYVFKPYGNATPTANQPHFTGTCKPIKKPGVGGTAGETWQTDGFRLDCDDEPELDVA